jgi:nitrite reductase/ring-hydroxylating ferredoxin subunit
MAELSRRDFLHMLRLGLLSLSGVLAAGGLLRFLGSEADPSPKTTFDLGPAGDYPPDSRTVIPEVPAVLVHNAAGFAAFSLTCTHLGCGLKESAGGFACACHGSQFDAIGTVTHGPARRPLHALRVDITPEGALRLVKSA